MIKTLNNQEGKKVRVRLDGETFEATIVKGDFTDCEDRNIARNEDTYTLRFDQEAGDGGTYWSPLYLEDIENCKHRGFDITSLGAKLDKHNIDYNVGKRAKINFDGEVRTGTIEQYLIGSEMSYQLKYDEPTDLGFTRYAPLLMADNPELINEVIELTPDNMIEHIGKKVIVNFNGLEKRGTLVKGSFYDIEGNFRCLEDFTISVKYDKRYSDNTLMFTDVLSVYRVLKELDGSIILDTEEDLEDSIEIGDVVKMTSDALLSLMTEDDIQVPYGIVRRKSSVYSDMLKVSSINPELHEDDWTAFESSLEKVYPIQDVKHGDLVLIKNNGDLTYGTYIEPNKAFIVGGHILESQFGVVRTYDGHAISVDHDTELYDMEVL